jgi:K+-transporting ATPase ATPase C chain
VKTILQTCLVLLVFTVLTGALYPAGVWAIGRIAWPEQANGNVTLIGQKFEKERYFFSRPSASDYGAVPSSASNLGPTSAVLKVAIAKRRADLAAKHSARPEDVPSDLLTSSASGLDPHISVAAAHFQVGRVAKARRLNAEQSAQLTLLVDKHVEGPQWGLFGDPRVNVLQLNRAVDEAFH